METIYPTDAERKFRKKNYGDIKHILYDKIECTICNNDLLYEIVSKKMIMVHSRHLFLCCYTCFFKILPGNEINCCILCRSSEEILNCGKCKLNICNRCVKNHKIEPYKNDLKYCFSCKPNILWKQRAIAANVLKVFSSQLDMPNGLLVNESDIDRDQILRKYLLKEARNISISITNDIKDRMCIKYLVNSYKTTVIKKLSEFTPKIDDTFTVDECLTDFTQLCEYVLENTCSNISNFKRLFNFNSQLKPSVNTIIKSILKSVDEDQNLLNNSKLNENLTKIIKNDEINQSLRVHHTEVPKLNNKQNIDGNNLNSLNNTNPQLRCDKNLSVVLERLDDSVLLRKSDLSNNVNTDTKQDIKNHSLKLFEDLSSSSSSSSEEESNTRKLRSHTISKINIEKKKKPTKKKKIDKKILDERSDDEKENDRLIRLDNIGKSSKKKVVSDEDDSDNNYSTNGNLTKNADKNTQSKLSLDKSNVETMIHTINNIDQSNSETDDNENEELSFKSIKNIFSEIKNDIGISEIDNNISSDESESSSIIDVINECLTVCNRPNVDHYRRKIQDNQSDINDSSVHGSELENQENTVMSESSSKDEMATETTKQQSLHKMSSLDDSDSNLNYKTNLTKRKLISSNDDSDSSSKYFKRTPKKRNKIDYYNKSLFDFSSSSSSDNSNSDEENSYSIKKRKRIKKLSSDESNEVCDDSDATNILSPLKTGRKNIHKVIKKTELSQLTINALKDEESRKKRIEQRQKIYNAIFELPSPMEPCKKLVLDFDPVTKQELVVVNQDLVKFLKPHQVEGVKFLWNSVFESLAQIKKCKGSGAIVAHCMGLGKTLQVITLVHTLFKYPETGIKTVLVVTPNATIENWCKEFHKWLKDIPEQNNFFVLNLTDTKTYQHRMRTIEEWKRDRGVLVTSYQLYRTIINFKGLKQYPSIIEGLIDPGPDLVICDEGHLLKNHNTAISKAINRIKTLRRIVLTGTPLQNNLKEYHCMVDFIHPNLLGSIKDFTNRFINPITNGQYSDSTATDVRLMKRRSHVLHRMLDGFVQRFDYSVLTPFLPPKHEYVIYLKMSDKQIELYQHFLDNYRQPELFTNYNVLQMIWTHPKLLSLYAKRREKKREDQQMKAFLNDSSSSNSNSNDEIEKYVEPSFESIITKSPEMDFNWWKPLLSKKDLETIYPYSKFIMMFSILQECEEIGDKVLLFSQSLFTLDLIQDYLENTEDIADDKGGPYGMPWIQGIDFFRIDGSVSTKTREECCEKFNDVTNTKMRLLLLSTKAFNLGINLVGANRVIIFDVTWNPSLNVQSIFRVFRFGQNKPCYIYRFVSEGSMEQTIYKRQISKLSLAFRVVDEQQIDRHFNAKDQEELYEFLPNTSKPNSTLNLPKDRLMAELILKHKDLVMDILEHDSLLQNNESEELDEHDRNAAWEDYQKEKEGLNLSINNQFQNTTLNNQFQNIPVHQNYLNMLMKELNSSSYRDDVTLFNQLRATFPHASMLQLNDLLIRTKEQHQREQ